MIEEVLFAGKERPISLVLRNLKSSEAREENENEN